jgi:hypothetical protein
MKNLPTIWKRVSSERVFWPKRLSKIPRMFV